MLNDSVKTMITKRLAFYRKMAEKTGVHFRCLDDDWTPDESPVGVVEADGDNITVRVNGPLDEWWGFSVRALIQELDRREAKSIHLLINSPGGLLDDGMALYLDLRARVKDGVKVVTESRGLVASAAVLPYLAGDERITSTGSQILIHNPWVAFCFAGSADEIKTYVTSILNHLEADEENLQILYKQRTGASTMALKDWLDSEKVFNAKDALRHGFATEVVDDPKEASEEEVKQFVQNLHDQFINNTWKGEK